MATVTLALIKEQLDAQVAAWGKTGLPDYHMRLIKGLPAVPDEATVWDDVADSEADYKGYAAVKLDMKDCDGPTMDFASGWLKTAYARFAFDEDASSGEDSNEIFWAVLTRTTDDEIVLLGLVELFPTWVFDSDAAFKRFRMRIRLSPA